MAETLSLVERIAVAILAQLKTIKQPTYEVTLVNPRRPKGLLKLTKELDCIFEFGRPSRLEDREDVASHEWMVPVLVTVLLNIPNDGDGSEPLDTRVNRVWAAVTKAMLVNRDLGLPGIVLDIEPNDPEFEYANSSQMSLICIFDLKYQHKRGDPFTVV